VFPTLNVDRNAVPEVKMVLDRSEFQSAISVLQAGAPKGHQSVTFHYDKDSGTLMVVMPCEAGGTNEFPLTQASITEADKLDTDFTVDYPYLKGIGDTFGLDFIEFGVTKRSRGGFISFSTKDSDEDDSKNNRYFSVIVWRT
jgi:hypothetical protein